MASSSSSSSPSSPARKAVPFSEVLRHNKEDDCWVVIDGYVYNMTAFLPLHPGGVDIVMKRAGRDATAAFAAIHPPSMIRTEHLPEGLVRLGRVLMDVSEPDDGGKVVQQQQKPQQQQQQQQKQQQQGGDSKQMVPPLDHMLNSFDFEDVARRVMKKEGWDYYSSGADDEITLRENHAAFQRVWFRPRVLVNVRHISTASTMLGHPVSFPLYITATALGKLAHPDGEVVLTKAAHTHGVVQMLPTLASCSLDEMCAAAAPGQVQFYQLYVNSNRNLTAEIVKKAEKLGVKALFITVDAPQLGRREKDMRNKFVDRPSDVQTRTGAAATMDRSQGTARALSSFIDPSLCWDDIKWFKSITNLPLVLKGVQCAEDALEAVRHGVAGVVLSNHGGRQLDFARSGLEVLVEVMTALREAGVADKLEVYVDGGVRRGTDILKAVALGAKAVGIGRPALYAMAGYGQAGVERLLSLLKEEFEIAMRLVGAVSLADLKPSLVCVRNLSAHVAPVPSDNLSQVTYIPLSTTLTPAAAPPNQQLISRL